jgi:hypothetical protein
MIGLACDINSAPVSREKTSLLKDLPVTDGNRQMKNSISLPEYLSTPAHERPVAF